MSILTLAHRLRHHLFNPYASYVRLLQRIGSLPQEIEGYAVPCTQSTAQIDILTVAFNVPELIEKQIEMVRKYVTDEHCTHIVADNSTSPEARQRIREICRQGGVVYLPIPPIIDKLISSRLFNYGLSHGAALNWTVSRLIARRRPEFLVLLDHDLFPIAPYSFRQAVEGRDFYGVARLKQRGWYVWPGFCVFRYAALAVSRPCFLPCVYQGEYLDAGGSNCERFFSRYDMMEQRFAKVETARVQKTAGLRNNNEVYHADCIQRIDEAWIHLINGSNYAHLKGKEMMVRKGLEKFR